MKWASIFWCYFIATVTKLHICITSLSVVGAVLWSLLQPSTHPLIFRSDILPLTYIFIFLAIFPTPLSTHRFRLTWRTQPSTTSSGPSSSRWRGTWESLVLRRWACPAPTSPLTTGACRQGRATVPLTALWPYWPSTLTARKRWGLHSCLDRFFNKWCLDINWSVMLDLFVLCLVLDGRCNWWHY